jgi:Flp pilus assembly protein TadG
MARRPRRRDGQGGTAIVELAFISLMLTTLIAGTWNYGGVWRAALRDNEAVRTGVRTGAAMGKDQLADWYALSGARASLDSSGNLNQVQRVVIFRSDTTDGKIPVDCKTATSTSSKCNIITGANFIAMTQADFNGSGCYTKATVNNWCPTSRIDVQATAEYFGMWIQITQTYDFKMLGSSSTIERQAVMRIEP